jgi:hypothetical protein
MKRSSLASYRGGNGNLFEAVEGRLGGLPLLMLWVIIVHFALVVYRPALHGPFLFDGKYGIVLNEDLRHPGEPWRLLMDHENSLTFDRRPVTGLSFLRNFQASGLRPMPYRLVNIALHLLSGFAFFLVPMRVARCFDSAVPRLLALSVAVS